MDLAESTYRRAMKVCGTFVAIVGIAALAGWATGLRGLRALHPNFIPMAPNTALAFIVLGLTLVVVGRVGGRRFASLGGSLVGLIGLISLSKYIGGLEVAVDQWFFRVRGERVGLAPIGKMALPTSIAFVAAGGAVLAISRSTQRKVFAHTTGVLGLITAMIGLVFSLGYLFSPNAPLLHGTEAIPMALNTALCFLVLGVGLASAAGPGAFPLLPLSGPSIRARLLRIFLPLVVGTVGLVAWLTHFVTTTAGSSSAALSSAALAAAAILLFGVILKQTQSRMMQQARMASLGQTAAGVVQSLLSNAIDACPTAGKVVVETRAVDDGIEILVSDNGHGIAPAIRDRVFDPFFTTKPVGKGTGLGLAISYGIVKDHGGTIAFESIPGQGTTFTVRLSVAPSGETLVSSRDSGGGRQSAASV